MNPTIRTLLVSAMALPASSIAQTLQAPDLHPQGYTFTYGVSNQQPSGWDWTNVFSLQDVALEFLPTDSTAYADGFASADFAQVTNIQGAQYAYYSFDAEGMGFWGGVDATGIQVIHPDEIVTMPFPFTVGDVHQDSLSFVFDAAGDQVHRDIHLTSVAAEWGALDHSTNSVIVIQAVTIPIRTSFTVLLVQLCTILSPGRSGVVLLIVLVLLLPGLWILLVISGRSLGPHFLMQSFEFSQ